MNTKKKLTLKELNIGVVGLNLMNENSIDFWILVFLIKKYFLNSDILFNFYSLKICT